MGTIDVSIQGSADGSGGGSGGGGALDITSCSIHLINKGKRSIRWHFKRLKY